MVSIFISVIIPTWNRASFLESTIKSVLVQTFQPLEILVCDDGSTDQSVQVVDSINSDKVRWLPGEHSGLPAIPRNKAVREAKGDWLAFLDSGDQWYPEKLERQIEMIKTYWPRLGAVSSQADRIDDQGMLLGMVPNYSKEMITFKDLLSVNFVVNSSVLIKKEVVEKAGGFPEDKSLRGVEDYPLWLRVTTKTDFGYIGQSLVKYRDEPEKSLRRYDLDPSLQKKTVLKNFIDWSLANKIPFHYTLMARWRLFRITYPLLKFI